MIVPDVNMIVYAYDADSPHHPRAKAWWEETLSSSVHVGIAWIVALVVCP